MRWRFTSTGRSKASEGTVSPSSVLVQTPLLLMETCTDTPEQQWQMLPDGHISYAGGRCLS